MTDERLEHLKALRTLELARAAKRIHDHYDTLERGEVPQQLGRRIFDRRVPEMPWVVDTARPARCRVADMADMDLHLSADSLPDAHWVEP